MFITTTQNLRAKRLIQTAYLLAIACFASLTAAAQTLPAPKPCFDFSGSGRTSFATTNRAPANRDSANGDLATNIVFRILNNGGAQGGGGQTVFFGLSNTDNITPGYYDADNRADIGVYRPSAATYFIRPSSSTTANSFQGIQFGLPTDVTGREADYDGDGRDDLTVVRDGGANLTWFFLRSSNGTVGVVNFGLPGFTADNGRGDYPIAGADYNGDGRADLTVIRSNPNGGDTYFVGDANTGALILTAQWGEFDTDFYVVGDYLGDRRADFAVYRAFQGGTNGTWFIRENGGGGTVIRQFGLTSLASVTDRPICGDYNGDGKQDIAIYRSSNSSFYLLNSPGFDTFTGVQFGQPGDFPVAGLRSF
ncbi:MAG: VCBS repeat-containing protein [Acidobacteriota bacterium]|nr:VCBS repeat-containing protein [Acidobacteriota bacterium]